MVHLTLNNLLFVCLFVCLFCLFCLFVCLFVCLLFFFSATSAYQHIANSRGCQLRECRKIREIQEVFELRRG